MMTAVIVAAFLSGIPAKAQQRQTPQTQTQQPAQPPAQPPQVPPPTTAVPQTPQTQQPPVSRPPAEQIPAPTPTPTEVPKPLAQVAVPGSELDRSTASALLERIEAIVNDALLDESERDKKNKPKDKEKEKEKEAKAVGTSGKLGGGFDGKAGKVTIDRSDLDEILAEVA